MSDTPNQTGQTKAPPKQSSQQLADSASVRRSKRPAKPSLLYADGFEDTQKVIGRKGMPKNPRNPNRSSNEPLSASEKEVDPKMEEETSEKAGGFPEYEDDDEYLPFVKPDDMEEDSEERVGYVLFRYQAADENRSTQRLTSSIEASGYLTRKIKKKPPYHEDYAYGLDPRKPKDKLKANGPQKKVKSVSVTKPAPAAAPSTTDFLDFMLNAAMKAQASQAQTTENSISTKSPRKSDIQNASNFTLGGKMSAPKFNPDDKQIGIIKKQKSSIKKTEPSKVAPVLNDDFYQRHLEYQDHYIKQAIVGEDSVLLKHTKNVPVTMKYQKRKFNLRHKDLVNSKIFDIVMGRKVESGIDEEKENKQEEVTDENWKKQLKEKENMLTAHFKELLKDYKPGVLV